MINTFISQLNFLQNLRDIIYYFRNFDTYSQHGEDIFILKQLFDNKTTGTYCDIGASHPMRLSNTFFMYQHGWNGILIEPIPNLAKKIMKWRKRDIVINCGVGKQAGSFKFYRMYPSVLSTMDSAVMQKTEDEGYGCLIEVIDIEVLRIVDILKMQEECFYFMSIDVEGLDLLLCEEIIQLPLEKLPKVICVEANSEDLNVQIKKLLSKRYDKFKDFGCNIIAYNSSLLL